MPGSLPAPVRPGEARRTRFRARSKEDRPVWASGLAIPRLSERTRYRRSRGLAAVWCSSKGMQRPPDRRRLAFQRSWFGRGRPWRFLGFDGKVGGQPFRDTAFENADLDAFVQQLGRDVRADELVRVRVVS